MAHPCLSNVVISMYEKYFRKEQLVSKTGGCKKYFAAVLCNFFAAGYTVHYLQSCNFVCDHKYKALLKYLKIGIPTTWFKC